MNEIVFLPLRADLLAGAAVVEQACLETAWSEKQLSELPEYAVYLTAVSGPQVVGIGCLYAVSDDAELMNLAVLPSFRGKGIGGELLAKLCKEAAKRGCTGVVLEVASRNETAKKLYEKQGFVPVGVRKGFYRGDDAILMKKELLPDGERVTEEGN